MVLILALALTLTEACSSCWAVNLHSTPHRRKKLRETISLLLYCKVCYCRGQLLISGLNEDSPVCEEEKPIEKLAVKRKISFQRSDCVFNYD